jgi:3',5'-nucleoside bisphosphate phosphatase
MVGMLRLRPMQTAPNYDLHCHSTASDGLLAPAELVQRAVENGVDILALTDHDEISGLAEARARAAELGLRFVDGVEVSVSWGGITIHIVGLKIDPDNAQLQQGLQAIRQGRAERAKKMAEDLARVGIPGSLEGAYAYVDNPNLIGRTHFARFLVEKRYVNDVKSAFQHYLVSGKPGYVPHQWATLEEGLSCIKAGGGIPIVAHPGRYKLTRTEMRKFLGEFKEGGGTGIEVVTSSHTPEQYLEYAILANEFGLLASRGSDFHGPGESRIDLGKLPNLAPDLKPVWHDW